MRNLYAHRVTKISFRKPLMLYVHFFFLGCDFNTYPLVRDFIWRASLFHHLQVDFASARLRLTSRKWRENTSPVLFVHFRLANIPKHSSAARISYDSLLGSFLTPSGAGVPNHEIDYVEFEFDLPEQRKNCCAHDQSPPLGRGSSSW